MSAIRTRRSGRMNSEDDFVEETMTEECLASARGRTGSAERGVQKSMEKKTGRPRLDISRDSLETLILTHGYSAADCARFFNISRSTITRLLRMYGLGIRQRYSHISDEDLDREVDKIVRRHGDKIGYKVCTQVLQGKGICLPLERVRHSMLRVDPEGVALRSRNPGSRSIDHHTGTTSERHPEETFLTEDQSVVSTDISGADTAPKGMDHRVPSKAVWHIDSLQKLERYKFMVHVGMDSHSRRILYLKVSDNNRPETVLHYFKDAVDMHGLPWKVETGQSPENSGVDLFMMESRKRKYKEPVALRSRITEKLTEDLSKNCLEDFHRLFQFLEWQDRLCVDKGTDMFALHFVFRDRVQDKLDHFGRSYNNCRTLIKRWGGVEAASTSGDAQQGGSIALASQERLPMSEEMNVLTPEEYGQLQAGLGTSRDKLGIDLYLWAREQAEAMSQPIKHEQGVHEEDVKPEVVQSMHDNR